MALFDLGKDPGEQNDIRSQNPKVYASLKAELIDYFSGINDEYPIPERSGPSPEKAPESNPKGKAPKSGSPIPEKLFTTRDQNGDGALSLREYTGKPVEEAPARTKIFKNLDANGDGKLTLEEVSDAAK